MNRIKILCITSLLAAFPAQAQTKLWSLGDCIEYALEKNIDVQQRKVEVENKELSLSTSRFSRLPALSGNVGENYNIGRTQNREGVYEDHGAATTSVGANASITVFQGFRINNQIKADKLSLEAATQDLEQARQDISLQITAFYLQVLYSMESEKLSEKQVKINSELVERAKKLVAGGRSSLSELYDAQSALARSESSLVDAANSTQTAILDLAQEMNCPDYSSIAIELPDVDSMVDHEALLLSPVDSIYSDYIQRRPAVMAAQKRVEQAEANIKVAKSSFWPSINVGASYSSGYYSDQTAFGGGGSFWNQLGRNGSTAIGASLSIPIFNRMSTVNSVKTAKNNARTSRLSLEQAKLNAFKEVQQAYVNAKAAYSKYLAEMKSVDAAKKAFEFEQKKFDNGTSTSYQFNEVRQKLETVTSQMFQAKYSFLLRAKILDFYKGEPLY